MAGKSLSDYAIPQQQVTLPSNSRGRECAVHLLFAGHRMYSIVMRCPGDIESGINWTRLECYPVALNLCPLRSIYQKHYPFHCSVPEMDRHDHQRREAHVVVGLTKEREGRMKSYPIRINPK